MLLREDLEKREKEILSPFACKSAESKGRLVEEPKCNVRTDFQRDRDRIIHSKAFRRLMHKTQVFLSPEGDHYRTRLTHTLEVAQISRTIARALNLNEDLTEAIALAHDLGHTPFGHNGETVLNQIYPGGFKHNEQSLRMVDVIEKRGDVRGLNLTMEVRDGILHHNGPTLPMTLEGQIVKISDRIAYINHDIDDAIRSGVIDSDSLPRECLKVLGTTHDERINNMVENLVKTSDGKEVISMTPDFQEAMDKLRSYMFKNVYMNSDVKLEEDLNKIETIIKSLYDYYIDNPSRLPDDFLELAEEYGVEMAVKDYIAGMTDRYALNHYSEIFVPKGWRQKGV
ncbi:MAG: deoxyguanosinetriphosphate triphosphohydrolase [Clostridia bacterium]|nr:deoxyguanosinetriphosphate triphosphohydrolase [Clostridia bacterium]